MTRSTPCGPTWTEAVDAARPDDRRSWWTTVDGREVCNRVNYLNDRSEHIAGLGSDRRFTRIAALGGPDLRDAHDRLDGNSVVIKVPGATEGLVDLPWHRDCGMGGHPVKCPMLNVGIQLDPATPAAGQLLMIAGSHRGTSRLPLPKEASRPPGGPPVDGTGGRDRALRPHAPRRPTSDRSRRPAGDGRSISPSSRPSPSTWSVPGQGYNDVLFARDEGHVRHVDQLR